MKFKQAQSDQNKEVTSKPIYEAFVNLILFELNKMNFIIGAKSYYFLNGYTDYKKFFTYLFKTCEEVKSCLIWKLLDRGDTIPELTISPIINKFENPEQPFEELAKLEDEFIELITNIIELAFKEKDYDLVNYFYKKIESDHLCCRALAAVKNKQNVLALLPCESHISEK